MFPTLRGGGGRRAACRLLYIVTLYLSLLTFARAQDNGTAPGQFTYPNPAEPEDTGLRYQLGDLIKMDWKAPFPSANLGFVAEDAGRYLFVAYRNKASTFNWRVNVNGSHYKQPLFYMYVENAEDPTQHFYSARFQVQGPEITINNPKVILESAKQVTPPPPYENIAANPTAVIPPNMPAMPASPGSPGGATAGNAPPPPPPAAKAPAPAPQPPPAQPPAANPPAGQAPAGQPTPAHNPPAAAQPAPANNAPNGKPPAGQAPGGQAAPAPANAPSGQPNPSTGPNGQPNPSNTVAAQPNPSQSSGSQDPKSSNGATDASSPTGISVPSASSSGPPSSAAATSGASKPSAAPERQAQGLTTGQTAGIALGAILGALLLGAVGFFMYRRAAQKEQLPLPESPSRMEMAGAAPNAPPLTVGEPVLTDSTVYGGAPAAPAGGFEDRAVDRYTQWPAAGGQMGVAGAEIGNGAGAQVGTGPPPPRRGNRAQADANGLTRSQAEADYTLGRYDFDGVDSYYGGQFDEGGQYVNGGQYANGGQYHNDYHYDDRDNYHGNQRHY